MFSKIFPFSNCTTTVSCLHDLIFLFKATTWVVYQLGSYRTTFGTKNQTKRIHKIDKDFWTKSMFMHHICLQKCPNYVYNMSINIHIIYINIHIYMYIYIYIYIMRNFTILLKITNLSAIVKYCKSNLRKEVMTRLQLKPKLRRLIF